MNPEPEAKLNAAEGTPPYGMLAGDPLSLERDLSALLNRYCAENLSNTPDFILAQFMLECLAAWNYGIAKREAWYNCYLKP